VHNATADTGILCRNEGRSFSANLTADDELAKCGSITREDRYLSRWGGCRGRVRSTGNIKTKRRQKECKPCVA